ncbi:SpoIIE family protein phosphatase [Oscillospiraceae bacterium MB08-C2-2]|nr:SpoIIE family protein phosphatase [Oscillospiraceae bacterium MB08-C2-2]
MQNRSEAVRISPANRLSRSLEANRPLIRLAGSALLGYVMANSFLFGTVAPFGVAFCAAVGGGAAAGAGLGAILGYVFTLGEITNIKYVTGIMIVLAIKLLFGKRKISDSSTVFATVSTLTALGISSAAVMLASDSTIYQVMVSLAEIFLATGAAYFFSRTRQAFEAGLGGAGRAELSCMIISCTIVVMGLSGLTISDISVGRVLSVLVILICAWCGGEAAGAVAGITAGVAMGLTRGDYSYVVASYGFGGLIAGVFSGIGRMAVAGAFILINAIIAIMTKPYTDIYTVLFEILVASVLYVAIPGFLMAKLRLHNFSSAACPNVSLTQKAVQDKLGDVSQALKEICSTTRQVSQKLEQMETGSLSSVYTKVADRVCRRCGLKAKCWQYQQTETMAALDECASLLKIQGTLDKESIPKYFTETCCKLESFVTELNTQFTEYVAREGTQAKVAKVRSVVTDQFEGIAMMVEEIAAELAGMKLQNEKKTQRVRDYFEKMGAPPSSTLCYENEFERLTVEVVIPAYQESKLNKTKAALDLCTMLEAELDMPTVSVRDKLCTLTFTEKATYTVALGAYQISNGGNRLCGDAYDYIRNRGGRSHFIISDGMGSGGSAAVDSTMTAELLSKLLSVGISHEAALKMVNSALLIKSGEETLATIDITTLDLYTGRAEFYKAGAAPTFVVKNGKATYLESSSLPVGILRGVAFEKSISMLKENDLVIMMSDGVITTGVEWIASELEANLKMDVQRLCEKLANTAKMRRTDGREDDITVLAIQVQKGI